MSNICLMWVNLCVFALHYGVDNLSTLAFPHCICTTLALAFTLQCVVVLTLTLAYDIEVDDIDYTFFLFFLKQINW